MTHAGPLGIRLGVAVGLLVSLGFGALSTSAYATCYSSTPTNAFFSDDPYDGEWDGVSEGSPEITGVEASLDASCTLRINPLLAGQGYSDALQYGDTVGIFVDTDGNSATGSALFQGADKEMVTFGYTGADAGPYLVPWTGTFAITDATPIITKIGSSGFSATLDQVGTQSPTTLGIIVVAIYDGAYDVYGDSAPEYGLSSFKLPITFTTAPPAPPAPPAKPAPAPVQTTPTHATKKKTSTKKKKANKKRCKKRKNKKTCRKAKRAFNRSLKQMEGQVAQ